MIGTWHEDRGDWETAKTWYSLADDGENPQALVGLASIHSRLGQSDRAEQLYEQALAVGGARSIEYQARHLAEQGDHEEALQLASKSFEHGNYEALTGLAWTYVSTDKSRAFAVMEHAMRLGFRDALSELIILSATVKDPELTLAYCDIAEQSGHSNTLRVAGTILLRSGHERRGAALLWRAFNAGVSWALLPLGELREKQGRPRSAREIYRRMAKAGQSYALVKLAALHERTGDSAAAERLAEQYERVSPPTPNNAGWHTVAEARQERGDITGAERILWRLAEQGDSSALVKIAEMRIKVGCQSGVEDILRRAMNSGSLVARKQLAKLERARTD